MGQSALPIQKLINIQVNLAPAAAQAPSVNSMLIVGNTNVIDVNQRIRNYSGLSAVAADFGTTAPEYLAAVEYFGQTPQPSQVYVGRWAKTATHGLLEGAPLTTAQQAIGNFTTFTGASAGQFKVSVDGEAVTNVTADFGSATNLNAVATAITTGLATATLAATCVWTGTMFEIQSTSTGATSTVSFATAGTAHDVSALLGLTAANSGSTTVAGIAAETALAALAVLDGLSTAWYGLGWGVAPGDLADVDYAACSAYVEASSNRHYHFVTDQEAAVITSGDTSSFMYLAQQAAYNRTFVQYSSTSPYAAISAAGRILTTNYLANNTTITLMYKQEPGVGPEYLNTSQADYIDAKNGNYFAEFNNNTAIIVNGQSSSGLFADEIIGIDWFAYYLQTNLYNALYSNPTKIPQTDPGNNQLVTVAEQSCSQGVTNGLFAAGVWDYAGFGQLTQGATMSKGYYVYAAPVATQASGDRAARKSMPIQIALKMAGAIHEVSVVITVNR